MKIKIGIVGTNKISHKFCEAAIQNPQTELFAVYSRAQQTGESFAQKYNIKHVFTDYIDFLDSGLDAVYIASPNYIHCEQAIQAMESGKHVLCEKVMAINEQEAEAMIACAKKNHVILLEAMKSDFDPAFELVKEQLPRIGTLRRVEFEFCQYSSRYDSLKKGKDHNIFRRECSAGALMDIGVYSVHILLRLLGKPDRIKGSSVMLRGDIDGAGIILAEYPDKIAEVSYSKITDSSLPNEIQGENGVLRFWGNSNSPENVQIIFRDGKEEFLYHRETENDMKYEVGHFLKMICGEESAEPHLQRSMDSMWMMDEIRRQCGIIFPADKL